MTPARAVALALAAVATGAIAGLLVLGREDGVVTERPDRRDRTMQISTSFEPRVHLFGDPIVAHVDLRFDRRRVDPDRIVVDALFRPYEQIGSTRRDRSDTGETVRIRVSYPLQCLARACSPGGPRRQISFPPVRVLYVLEDVRARANDTADWPSLDVASRLGAFDIQEASWRGDLDPPAVSYRVRAGLLAAGLGGSALLLAVAGSLLAWRLLERRPEEEGEAVPIETLPPLQRVLEQLGALSFNGAVPERRRALERLARELERVEQHALAARARRLAWSPAQPDSGEVDRLSADVHGAIGSGDA